MDWYTIVDIEEPEVLDLWADIAQLSGETISLLLEVARDQVLAYAPALADPAIIPPRYRLAQMRQAVNLYRASIADAGGQVGDDGSFAISPRPMDWHVKNILRPAKGRPRVR